MALREKEPELSPIGQAFVAACVIVFWVVVGLVALWILTRGGVPMDGGGISNG